MPLRLRLIEGISQGGFRCMKLAAVSAADHLPDRHAGHLSGHRRGAHGRSWLIATSLLEMSPDPDADRLRRHRRRGSGGGSRHRHRRSRGGAGVRVLLRDQPRRMRRHPLERGERADEASGRRGAEADVEGSVSDEGDRPHHRGAARRRSSRSGGDGEPSCAVSGPFTCATSSSCRSCCSMAATRSSARWASSTKASSSRSRADSRAESTSSSRGRVFESPGSASLFPGIRDTSIKHKRHYRTLRIRTDRRLVDPEGPIIAVMFNCGSKTEHDAMIRHGLNRHRMKPGGIDKMVARGEP